MLDLTRIEKALRETTGYLNGTERAEAAENAAMLEAEREESTESEIYPCPDILWQGIFADVSDAIGSRSWEVWAGVFAALAAITHKNLWWDYFQVPLYGMAYILLIGPTTSRKSLAARICRSLLPPDYCIREGVSSGAALLSVLGDIKTDKKGTAITPIASRPAILVVEEWGRIIKYAGIEGATLADDLNSLFHRRWPWNVTRSIRGVGGGDLVIPNPTLSLLGMTTPEEFRAKITPAMITSGFLNRHLILPCPRKAVWRYWRSAETLELHPAHADEIIAPYLLTPLLGRSWGNGDPIEKAYSPAAAERISRWGATFFEAEKNQEHPTLAQKATARLDVYSHLVSLHYAWAQQSPTIDLPHVEAAITIVTTAKAYTLQLVSDLGITPPIQERFRMDLDEKILLRVQSHPGHNRQSLQQALKKHASFTEVGKRLSLLLSAGLLVEHTLLPHAKMKGVFIPEQ